MLPSWLGAGTALAEELLGRGAERILREVSAAAPE